MDRIHAMSTPHLHAMREPLLRRASRRLRRPRLRASQPTTAAAAAEIC